MPFQDALDLVRTRKVYLKAGYVYIPHQDIVTIVLNDFRTRLSKALAVSVHLEPPSCVFTLRETVGYEMQERWIQDITSSCQQARPPPPHACTRSRINTFPSARLRQAHSLPIATSGCSRGPLREPEAVQVLNEGSKYDTGCLEGRSVVCEQAGVAPCRHHGFF